MVQRIIGGKAPGRRTAASRAPARAAVTPARPHPAPSGAALRPAAGAAREAPPEPPAPAVQHVRVGEDGEGQRLDNYLVKTVKGVPKTHLYRIIRSGEVRVNRARAAADTRLAVGDTVRLPPLRQSLPEPGAAPVPGREFPVVYEDEHLLALDKPAGVAVHGGSGVSFGVIEQLRRARPEARFLELVHRLDRETSGLLLVAKKRSALTALQRQFRARETGKTYAALVVGDWPASRRRIDVPLHKYLDAAGERRVRTTHADDAEGLHSVTLVKVAARYGAYTLLDVTIQTGRTHQIRVHLAHAGHPIVGDDKYGDFALNKTLARGAGGPRFERMFLHARRLAFDHPARDERLVLEAPLPPECRALLAALAPSAPAPAPAAP